MQTVILVFLFEFYFSLLNYFSEKKSCWDVLVASLWSIV